MGYTVTRLQNILHCHLIRSEEMYCHLNRSEGKVGYTVTKLHELQDIMYCHLIRSEEK